MVMLPEQGWQELHTKSGPKCPKLFYKFAADVESGYTLQLCDLIALFEASLGIEEIREYAKSTRTTIDPSSERSQLKKLFEKLSESLADGKNTIYQDDLRGNEVIKLSTVLELKRPLQPLKWDFYLEPQGAVEMAEHILRPCLHEAFHAQEKIKSLFEVISSKDRVIAKLLDKFEASAMDLSLVFPSITGVRARNGQLTVQQAQRHVPGLSKFDKSEWQAIFESDSSPYSSFDSGGMSKLIIGCKQCPKHTSEQHQRWLHKLPKSSATTSQIAMIEANRSSSPVRNTSDSETQFETQKKRKLGAQGGDGADSTESEPEQQNRTKRVKRSLPKTVSRNNDPSVSSPLRSSSPLLPPLPDDANSHNGEVSSGSSETSSDMDLDAAPKSKSNANVGRLGKQARHPTKPNTRASTGTPMQSSSPTLLPLVPDSSIPSSPPANDQKSTTQGRPKSSSSRITPDLAKESQAEPVEEPEISRSPSTPRKLGRLGVLRNSTSATPDHQRTRDVSASKERSKSNSTQSTPTRRRLGQLGRGSSQSQSQPPEGDTTSVPEPNTTAAHDAGAESDASTASTASPTPSPPPSPSTAHDNTRQLGSSRPSSRQLNDRPEPATGQSQPLSASQASVSEQQLTPEPEVEELTKEEKADRRRKELKRKIEQPVKNVGASGASNLRKKRKF